jgi:hypothetical protein
MRLRSFFVPQLALFTLLNVADLLLTRLLLGQGLATVYEGNPVAAWLLGRHGWVGVACFKLATALLVAGAAAAVFARRPRLGVGVLAFGCATLAGVVVYSVALLGTTRMFRGDICDSEAAAAEREGRLNNDLRTVADCDALKTQLTHELIAGRCTIPQAVERLMTMDKRHDPVWMKVLRDVYALESDRDCLAANFMTHVLRIAKRNPELAGRAPEWLAAYEAQFRVPGQPPWEQMGLYRPDSRAAYKPPAAPPPPARPDT